MENASAVEPVELVGVTPQMVAAGLREFADSCGAAPTDLVANLYLAMEYQRLGMLGQLSSFGDKALKVRDGEACGLGGT